MCAKHSFESLDYNWTKQNSCYRAVEGHRCFLKEYWRVPEQRLQGGGLSIEIHFLFLSFEDSLCALLHRISQSSDIFCIFPLLSCSFHLFPLSRIDFSSSHFSAIILVELWLGVTWLPTKSSLILCSFRHHLQISQNYICY